MTLKEEECCTSYTWK